VSGEIYSCANLAQKILLQTQADAEQFLQKTKRKPCLAVILVGENPASQVYVKKKGETCIQYGIDYKDFRLNDSENFSHLENLIQHLNKDPTIDGILVQSPLPRGWDEKKIQAAIDPAKDVDGFNPWNAGMLSIDAKKVLRESMPPCTPAGVMEILKEKNISIAGKHAVVVGRSNIVGKPMALMLLAENATITVCHSLTTNLIEECKRADILIVAAGVPKLIREEHIKSGAVVIDVGMNRLPNPKNPGKNILVGDCHTKLVAEKASFVTPVPGGVGPMTIAMLIRNTVRAASNRLITQ